MTLLNQKLTLIFTFLSFPLVNPLVFAKCDSFEVDLVQKLGSKQQWLGKIGTHDFLMKSPTKNLGEWIEFSKTGRKTQISRITSRFVQSFEFDSSCNTAMTLLPIASHEVPNEFGIPEMQSLMKQNKKGIFLVWSPKMPYSLKTLKTYEKLQRKHKFVLVPLLDPGLSPSEVQEAKKNYPFPSSYFRQASNLEFSMREINLHYPATISFSKTQMSRVPHFGHRSQKHLWARLQSDWAEIDGAIQK